MAEGKYTFRVADRAHKTRSRTRSRRSSASTSPPCAPPRSARSRSAAASTRARPVPGRRRSSSSARARRSSSSKARRQSSHGDSQNKADEPRPPLRDLPAARGGHRDEAEQGAHQGRLEVRWPQLLRPRREPPPRRRGEAPLPPDRLQADQGRDPRQGRDDRVRPEPDLLHRAAALRGRREALHPRSAGRQARRRHRVRREGRHPARERAPALPDTDRHPCPQRRARLGAGWPAGPRGGREIQVVAKEARW